MVSKKSFTLLVARGTTPFFAFVSIISVKDCRLYIADSAEERKKKRKRKVDFGKFFLFQTF